MTDLDKLIEAVEGGVEDEVISFTQQHFRDDVWSDIHCSYRGDLNAAKALHDALLGDVHWFVNNMGEACVMMSADGEPNFKGDADNPARAWLVAILKAYRSLQ